MCDVHCDAHVREMEAVAQPDQCQRDYVMQNQLFEILPGLLEHKQQDKALLRPVARLQQIIRFEQAFMAAVREALEHAARVEIPHRAPAHDVQAKGPENAEIDGRVELLHEAALLATALDAQAEG